MSALEIATSVMASWWGRTASGAIRRGDRTGTLGVIVPRCASTSQAGKSFDVIRQRIQKAVKNEEAVSMSVAVAVDGKIIWEEGFGLADRERRIPATSHTRYAIGSISKPFTATGLMILVERGLVDLNRAANQYLGDGQTHPATQVRIAIHPPVLL